MNAKSFVIFATLTIFASLASSIALAERVDRCAGPPDSGDQCEIRGNDIRCLYRSGDPGTNTCLKILNKSTSAVSLWYDEWHSSCGFPGRKDLSQQYNLRSTERVVLTMGSTSDIFFRNPCTEGFVLDCRVGGASARCSDVLTVYTYKRF